MVFLVAITSHPPTVRIVDGFLESKVGAGGRQRRTIYKVVVEHDWVVKLESSFLPTAKSKCPSYRTAHTPMGPPTHHGEHGIKIKLSRGK